MHEAHGDAQRARGPEAAPAGDLESVWTRIKDELRLRLQREQFETWFQRAGLVRADAEHVCVCVQNNFTRDWISTYYRDALEAAAAAALGAPRRVEFSVDPELNLARRRALEAQANESAAPAAAEPVPEPREAPVATPARPANSVGLPPIVRPTSSAPGANAPLRRGLAISSDVVLNQDYLFDNFVVGPCNRFAHAAAVGVSESPGKAYNPFFMHGSVGLGKTHLLQSLCHALLDRNPSPTILYLSCETFVNHFISALENGDLQKFRTKYRNVDVLVVDDIHLLANKERTQEEFFHTFNTLYNAGKQIVLSSDSPPKDIPTLQNRLVSRFKWGLVTEVEQPCYETRMAILKRKSRDRGSELPDEVARLLAERIESNIRELEGAVTKVLGYAALARKPVSVELAREALREVFSVRRAQPSIDDVMRVVCDHFGLKPTDLQSRRRTSAIAYPRQIGMFLARRITHMSLSEIGGHFGGRDHTTVLYGVQKIGEQVQEDAQCRDLLAQLEARLRVPAAHA
jgi:chromosomal replication initiator protein